MDTMGFDNSISTIWIWIGVRMALLSILVTIFFLVVCVILRRRHKRRTLGYRENLSYFAIGCATSIGFILTTAWLCISSMLQLPLHATLWSALIALVAIVWPGSYLVCGLGVEYQENYLRSTFRVVTNNSSREGGSNSALNH